MVDWEGAGVGDNLEGVWWVMVVWVIVKGLYG